MTSASRAEADSDLRMLQSVMIRAVRVGSRVAVRAQIASQQEGRVEKLDKSPVTIGDFAVQACISHILSEAFPDTKLLGEEDDESFGRLSHEIRQEIVTRVAEEFPQLGEEGKVAALIGRGSFGKSPKDKPPCFVLDPIDGTKGFIRGEQYAVCLGYLSAAGVPTASVVGCPNMPHAFFSDEKLPDQVGYLFDAISGRGVRMRPLHSDDDDDTILREWTKSSTEESTSSRRIIMAESYEKSHTKGDTNLALMTKFNVDPDKDVLRIDSQVKFAALVRGDANVYFRFVAFDICIWDVLPGYVLVVESGGRVTDKQGKPVDFTLGRTIKSNSLIVTAAGMGKVHDQLLAAVARFESEPRASGLKETCAI